MTTVNVYTDGACSGNPGAGGWAAVFSLEKSLKIISGNEKTTTNNRMELMAVIKAVEIASKKGIEKLIINSDSSYVVNAINCGWIEVWKSKGWMNAKKEEVKNVDLWKRLDSLLSSGSIKVLLVKVKGHNGVVLNEIADGRAREEVIKAKLLSQDS